MRKNLIETILFIFIVLGMPILASFIVEAIASIVTMEMIVNVMYIVTIFCIVKILKEAF